MHSHILPGIDDGAATVEDSIDMVKGLMALGLKRSVATPHVISDMYRNTPESIGHSLQMLRTALQQNGLDYRVDAAAEYMMDAAFFQMLERQEPLLCIKEKIILTEFSFGSIPENPRQMSFAIQTAGYTPILAHPERYTYFYGNNKAYHLLDELGFQLQININSLLGYYGAGAEKAAKYILKNNLCRYLGTDMHRMQHYDVLHHGRAQLAQLLDGKQWNSSLE